MRRSEKSLVHKVISAVEAAPNVSFLREISSSSSSFTEAKVKKYQKPSY
jgi:hypothetical protein